MKPALRGILRATPNLVYEYSKLSARIETFVNTNAISRLHQALRLVYPKMDFATLDQFASRCYRTQALAAVSQRYLETLSPAELAAYIRGAIRLDVNLKISREAQDLFDDATTGPIIMVSPHFGCFALGALWAVARVAQKRAVGVFYNPPELNAYSQVMTRLLLSISDNVRPIMNDRPGMVSAARLLKAGGALIMMPDAFSNNESTLFVPFFSRLVRAMPGIAYFSRRSGAPIIPGYSYWHGLHQYKVVVEAPLPKFQSSDSKADIWLTTRAIFKSMEDKIVENPEQWMLLNSLPQQATAIKWPLEVTQAQRVANTILRDRTSPEAARHAASRIVTLTEQAVKSCE